MHVSHTAAISALALSLALVGSGCTDTDVEPDLIEDVDGKLDADSTALIGSWNTVEISTEPNPESWLALVLKRDKRFYLWPEAGDGFEGTYALKRTTANPPKRYLVLTPEDDGEQIKREYRIAEEHVDFRRTGGAWRPMERSEQAVCVVVEDCSLQNLKHPSCLGAWDCDEGACSYRCE